MAGGVDVARAEHEAGLSMSYRTLFLLVVALAILGFLATRSLKSDRTAPTIERGRRVLSGDVNEVVRLEVVSGTQRVALARSGDQWVVESLWNYPARFEELAALLRNLDRLRIAEPIRGGERLLAEFGLDDNATNPPVAIRLFGANGRLMDEIRVGQPRLSPAMTQGFRLPDSRYVQIGHGAVVLAEPYLEDVRRRASDWIRGTVLDVRAADIRAMHAEPHHAAAYSVQRTEGEAYVGSGALEGKPINAQGADLWFRALQGLTAQTIADPVTPAETLGRTAADVVQADLTNGVRIRVELGAFTAEEQRRYAWLTAEASDASARAEAERLQKEIGGWIYELSYSQAAKLMVLPEQMTAADAQAAAPDTAGSPTTPAAP